jgi:hypothetical protein
MMRAGTLKFMTFTHASAGLVTLALVAAGAPSAMTQIDPRMTG